MERWVARHNIEDYERRLAAEADPAKRKLVEQLLEQERERYRAAVASAGKPASS